MTEQEDERFKYQIDDFDKDGRLKGSNTSLWNRIVGSAKAGLNNALSFYIITFVVYPIADLFGFRATHQIFVGSSLPAIYELCLLVAFIVFVLTFVSSMMISSPNDDDPDGPEGSDE